MIARPTGGAVRSADSARGAAAANRLTLKKRQNEGLHDDLLTRGRVLFDFRRQEHLRFPTPADTNLLRVYSTP